MENVEDILIREFQSTDRPMVEKFFAEIGEETAYFFNQGRGNEMLALSFFEGKCPNHLFWMAEADADGGKEMAGYVFLWDIGTTAPWLGIAVADKWKGRHLGRRLIAAAKTWCLENGCGALMLTTAKDNVRGQGLYERCGFEKLGVHANGELFYLLRFERK